MAKRIAIVGGGLAGLAAGVYAQKAGFEAHIFEQHSLPGGVCTSWKRDGYWIDACIHWLMGVKPNTFLYNLYYEVGALQDCTLAPVKDFVTYSWFENQREFKLRLTPNIQEWSQQLLEYFPDDKKFIEVLVEGARAFQSFDMEFSKPQELWSVLDKLKFFWKIRKQFKYFGQYTIAVKDFVKIVKNQNLKWIVESLFLPEVPTVFIFMILGDLTANKLAYIPEGSLNFAKGISKKFKELGGVIHYNSEVTGFKYVDQKVEKEKIIQKVILKNGEELAVDHVIGAGDLHSLHEKILNNQFWDSETQKRFKEWPLFDPILIFNFGVKDEFEGLASSWIFKLTDPLMLENENPITSLFVKLYHHDYKLNPKGLSVLQVIVPTEFEKWKELKNSQSKEYDSLKGRLSFQLEKALIKYFPQIENKVEMRDVATPQTYVRYTHNYKGAWEGWLMTPESFSAKTSKKIKGIKNLWLCGQWVEPGGGVPTVLMSGRNVVELIRQTQEE